MITRFTAVKLVDVLHSQQISLKQWQLVCVMPVGAWKP